MTTAEDSRHGEFMGELESLINRYSLENRSNTPDFLLAMYLSRCLDAFDEVVTKREKWYGRPTNGLLNLAAPASAPQPE